MDFALPADVLLRVLAHLTAAELCSARRVCRSWHQAGLDPKLWKTLYLKAFTKPSSLMTSRASSNVMGGSAFRVQNTSCSVPGATVAERANLDDNQDWNQLYKKRCEVERAWSGPDERVYGRLTGHGDFIRCVQLWGSTLVSASGSVRMQDCSVRVWDMDTGACRHVLGGYKGPVWAMMVDEASMRLATGDDAGGVRLWDVATAKGVELQDAPSSVRALYLEDADGQLVAGCDSGNLLLWNLRDVEGLFRVQKEEGMGLWQEPGGVKPAAATVRVSSGAPVTSIQVQSGLCAAATSLRRPDIVLWNTSGGSWEPLAWPNPPGRPFSASSSINSMSFEIATNRLLAGGEDGDLHVFDLQQYEPRRYASPIHAHQFDEHGAAAAVQSGEALLWDLRTYECRQRLQHGVPLHSLVYDDKRLVSGGWDGSVFIWDLRTGKLLDRHLAHEERVWSVSMDDYHIVSAALDHSLVVRSFLPPDDRFKGWAAYEVDRAERSPGAEAVPTDLDETGSDDGSDSEAGSDDQMEDEDGEMDYEDGPGEVPEAHPDPFADVAAELDGHGDPFAGLDGSQGPDGSDVDVN